MSEPLPQFCVGEAVLAFSYFGSRFIGQGEIVEARYLPRNGNQYLYQEADGIKHRLTGVWVYRIPDLLPDRLYWYCEQQLKKLPPNERLSWEELKSQLSDEEVAA